MKLGEYLRSCREGRGRTARATYEALGIPKPTLYWWEGPRSRIDPVDIRRLLTFYGCAETEIAWALHLRSLVTGPTVSDVSRGGSISVQPSEPTSDDPTESYDDDPPVAA